MKKLSELFGRIYCQVIILKLGGADTERMEYLMEEVGKEIFKITGRSDD